MTQKRMHYLDQSSVDPEALTGTCKHCGDVAVRRHPKGHWRCSVGYKELREKWGTGKVGRHGLNKKDRDKLVLEAKACAFCGSTVNLVVDHCHATMRIRGVLCHGCNVSLGHLEGLMRKGVLSDALAWIKN